MLAAESPMLTVDPIALARRQIAIDKERTKTFPALLDHKLERMTASPLAFLRGAAPLFYELLAAHRTLAEGPRGKGWLTGDLHLENFGAYRPLPLALSGDRHDHDDAAFDLNDFDDAVIGPWRVDVLRLTTSLILAGRELGAGGVRVLQLAEEMLGAYVGAAFDRAKTPKLPKEPAPVTRLVDQVAERTRKQLLDGRTEVVKGERRFVRGARYAELPRAIAKRVPAAFARYVKSLDDEFRPEPEALEVIDAAWRIAGTGSLGGTRIAVLVRGKGGPDGAWVFDMKEQGTPSATVLLGRPPKKWRLSPAERVVTAYRACVARPAWLLGTSTLEGLSLFVRRLLPQEDKLDLASLRDGDLDALAVYLGALVGRAHARGGSKYADKNRKKWTESECERADRSRDRHRRDPRGDVPGSLQALGQARQAREALEAGAGVRVVSAAEFFEAIARRYDRAYALDATTTRARMKRVLSHLPPAPARVLDLGVGTGRELGPLQDAGYEVTGLDVSPSMLAQCARRARPVTLVEADLWQGLSPLRTARSTP